MFGWAVKKLLWVVNREKAKVICLNSYGFWKDMSTTQSIIKMWIIHLHIIVFPMEWFTTDGGSFVEFYFYSMSEDCYFWREKRRWCSSLHGLLVFFCYFQVTWLIGRRQKALTRMCFCVWKQTFILRAHLDPRNWILFFSNKIPAIAFKDGRFLLETTSILVWVYIEFISKNDRLQKLFG